MAHNCWKFTNCGREECCPAYPHNGRTCYAVTGTLCREMKQRSYMEQVATCRDSCAFYKSLMETRGVELVGHGV